MRSAAQRRHSLVNLARAGTLRPRTWVSIEACDRIDVPQLLAAQPPTDEEKARGFAVRIVDCMKFVLKRKERWPGAYFWFLFSLTSPDAGMLWSAAMHAHKLACLLTFALVAPAAAEIPYSCQGGTFKRMSIKSDRTVLRIDALIPSGLDPVMNGLSVEVNYEPEADPANLVFSVTLPNTGPCACPAARATPTDWDRSAACAT